VRGEKAEHLATDSTGCERMSLNHALYGIKSCILTTWRTNGNHSDKTLVSWPPRKSCDDGKAEV
jgi:hypothetical protein